jgi:spore photoproduct lyase
MSLFKRELERLKAARSATRRRFQFFGVNKSREITRLVYEISKRDNVAPARIIAGKNSCAYHTVKRELLQRRFPQASSSGEPLRPYLPKIELAASDRFDPECGSFYPKNIFIEKDARDTFLARRFRENFPDAKISHIDSLKDYNRLRRGRFRIKDYSKRRDAVFIVNERHDFFKRCPCTPRAAGCGYHIFNLGFGCVFECVYCFLQEYTNSPGIILPANIDRFFDRFASCGKRPMRIGTGEFSDSLALDRITGYSPPIIEFFRNHKGVTFEFKTKSARIENILKVRHAANIVISWSLNPQEIIDDNEYFTAPLGERINAAAKCVEAGYRVGFHLDPIVYFNGWERSYRVLLETLFDKIAHRRIAWISLGTFRFSPALKQVIERRFPANKILDEELLLGYDNKLRYPRGVRRGIYKKMADLVFGHSRRMRLYLCMEDLSMWKDVGLPLKMPCL